MSARNARARRLLFRAVKVANAGRILPALSIAGRARHAMYEEQDYRIANCVNGLIKELCGYDQAPVVQSWRQQADRWACGQWRGGEIAVQFWKRWTEATLQVVAEFS
jgi:hypothetical protein